MDKSWPWEEGALSQGGAHPQELGMPGPGLRQDLLGGLESQVCVAETWSYESALGPVQESLWGTLIPRR